MSMPLRRLRAGPGWRSAPMWLPASIQADVIDLDTAETGSERAGLYLGCGRWRRSLPLRALSAWPSRC